MANENKDIIRVEVAGASLAATVRQQQIGFESDGTHRLGYKKSNGIMDYWTPDGSNWATNVKYTNTVYPSVSEVSAALDNILDPTFQTNNVSDTFIPFRDGSNGWADSSISQSTNFTNTVDIAGNINLIGYGHVLASSSEQWLFDADIAQYVGRYLHLGFYATGAPCGVQPITHSIPIKDASGNIYYIALSTEVPH